MFFVTCQFSCDRW